MTLTIATAASGVARTAHYVVPTGQAQPIPTLLLEPQRTNLCIRSEEFDTWSTSGTAPTVSANTTTAPDGTLTADTVTANATNSTLLRACTFTGDGEKCLSIFLKEGTSAVVSVRLVDITAGVNRHIVNVTWTAGVPVLSTSAGAGTLYPVEALSNGWYRILFSATGVVAANTNQFRIVPDSVAGVGSTIAWGAQVENAVVPSSYIKTEATTVTRNADSLYFPFTAPPQAMTVYVRGVELGATGAQPAVTALAQIGVGTTTARFGFERTTGTTYRTRHASTAGAGTSTNLTPTTRGDVVELRGVLSSLGATTCGLSVDAAAETLGATTSPFALDALWSAERIYVGGNGLSAESPFSFTHVLVAAGEQTMDTMRQLAGVV